MTAFIPTLTTAALAVIITLRWIRTQNRKHDAYEAAYLTYLTDPSSDLSDHGYDLGDVYFDKPNGVNSRAWKATAISGYGRPALS